MQLVLLHRSGRRIFVEFSGNDVHTQYGVLDAGDLKPGRIAKTNTGEELLVLKPSMRDIIHFMKMGAKPIFEYDTGIFASLLGIERGSTIIEAGTGSGGSTIVLANFSYPGKVYSFEVDGRFHEIAKENLGIAGLENVVLIRDDVRNASKYVKCVDAVFLDLKNPEEILGPVSYSLKPGGYLGVYTPVFDSVKPVWRAMEDSGFVCIECVYLGLDRVVVKKYARFKQKHFGFPGFFIVGRKFGGQGDGDKDNEDV